MTLEDTFAGSLDGGGAACLQPYAGVEVDCYDRDNVGHDLLGQFCWKKDGDCGPVPREVLLDGSVEVTLEGGAVEGVKVELAFEPMGLCEDR